MKLEHRLTGYHKASERLERAFPIPPEWDNAARSLAHVPDSDPDAVGGYPLSPDLARAVARLIDVSIDVDRYDWFYEPVAVPVA